MNNVNIIGRITADTELKITESGTTVCEFNIAIARNQNTADFIKCVAFNKTADTISKYCGKGSKVGISGSLRSRRWEDKNGKKHSETYIEVGQVTFCESKKGDTAKYTDDKSGEGFEEISANDDLPF